MSPELQALLRHILTAVGGAIAARYGVDGDMVEAGAGALVTLASIGWSIWDKRRARRG